MEEKEKDITALTEEIDTLNRVNYQNTSSPWISQDEFDYFSSLESLFSEQKKGLDYWQQQLYPSIKNYEKTLFAYEQTLHDIQTYQEIWENEQQLLTKKNDLQKKEEALSIQLENHRVLTQEQRLLRDQQLVLLQERISPIAPEKKQFSLFLFSIGLFSALLFAVLFSFSSLWGLGWVFSFLLIFSSFFPFKSISQPSSERETSTFDKAKKEKDQWLLSTKAQEQRLLLALEEIRQQLESLAIQQEQAPLTEEIPSLKHRLSLFHEEAGGLLGNLNHGKEHIQHHLSLLKSTFPSLHVFLFPFEFEEDSEKIQQIIADELDNTKEEMEDFLSQKNLLSAKDFHQAFVASQSELNHQNALQERKKLLTEKEKAFLLFLSTYSPVENMAQGLPLFSYFQENFFLLKELKKTITLQGRALQISPLTLENVENRLLEQGSFKAEEPQEDIMLLKEKLYALQEVDYVMELSHLRSLLTIPTQSPQTLEKAIAIQKEKIKKMEDYYQALTLALQAMEKANERMRTHFSPLLNQKTSVIFAKITGNVNATLTIDKDYDFHIKKGLHYKPWGYLSQGTIDQGYFSLRIAISELITGPEKPPLFLDDPFIQYDSNREERALVFLKRHAFTTPLQVILFTSNGHSLALAKEKNIPVFRLSS